MTSGSNLIMAFTTSVRPRKQIDYKKLNEGDQLPFVSSKVRVSRVLNETFLVERIIARRQSPNIVSNIYFIFIYTRQKKVYIKCVEFNEIFASFSL